jgi:hypothetical protein
MSMSDPIDLSEQRAVLENLRARMEQAKALYEGARAEYDRALTRMQELGMTHPDGMVHHATKTYNFALRCYRLALNDYNRFVLDRKLPRTRGTGLARACPHDGANHARARVERREQPRTSSAL